MTLKEDIKNIPLFEMIDVFTRRESAPYVKQNHYRCVVEKGKNDAIAIPTERYNLVQIRDIFTEALSTVEKAAGREFGDARVDGEVFYYDGRGELELFLKTGHELDVGLLVGNSVDTSSAVHIDFITKINGDTVLVPRVKKFQRYHSAREIEVEVEDYFSLLSQVSRAWREIATKLGKKILTPEDVEALADDLHLGKKFKNRMENYTRNHKLSPMRFWDFILMALRYIRRSNYKSDIHYREKVRRTADVIMKWAVTEVL